MAKVVLTPSEEAANLKAIVVVLNDTSGRVHDWSGKGYGSSDAEKLRRLIRAWRAMMKATKGRQSIDKMSLSPEDRADLDRFVSGIQTHLEPDGTLSVIETYPHPYDLASILFVQFLRNGQRSLLGGPCPGIIRRRVHRRLDSDQCGRWFIKRDWKQEFHDHRCAATARQARKRESDHDRDIERAKRAIRNYADRPARFRDMDWKTFVYQDSDGRISKRFLTLAVRIGELSEPNGSGVGIPSQEPLGAFGGYTQATRSPGRARRPAGRPRLRQKSQHGNRKGEQS